jgi:mannose-6-phosphate isomerase-like protein (cupin superfamily)
MEDIKIVRSSEIKPDRLIGAERLDAGWIKRIIYPPEIITGGLFLGIAEVNPGYSPHRWHTHIIDKTEEYEFIYPENFEEMYYIVSGSGIVQWITEKGKSKEKKVNAGDAIFFPRGVPKHQLQNNGTEKMLIVYCGYPKVAKVEIHK